MRSAVSGKKWLARSFLLIFLFFGVVLSVVTARGEDDLPPAFSEEDSPLPPFFTEESVPPPPLFPEESPPPAEPENDGWSDWEEDWTGSWNGAGDEMPSPEWELWREEDQEQPPEWGPDDPDDGPAFPEEEPEEQPSSAAPPSSSQSSSSKAKAPKSSSSQSSKKKTARQGEVEPSDDGTPTADFPGILPRRVTEADVPQDTPPLWYRGTDPNILWILLVAFSLIVLGLRILWKQEDGGKRRRYDDYGDD